MPSKLLFRLMALVAMLMTAATAHATEAGWALLREGGHVVLLRHAAAPGTGDPAGFAIDDCKTQRNLSDRGRQQARRLGALFEARAEPVERVLSSRYCRCKETAELAFREDNQVELFPPLDLPPADPEAARQAHDAVLKEIAGYSGSGNMVLVTHEEVIQALTGQGAREGEAVIVRVEGDTVHVLGRIIFN